MSKIGIIVDGQGDLLSLKCRYSNLNFIILKTDGPRGHTAVASEIISKSRKQISMLKFLKCEKVILLIDFESRAITIPEFIDELSKEIIKVNLQVETKVIVPNTMIENWYLADIEVLSKKKKFIKDNLKQKNYEGTNGKNEIKRLYNANYSYSETEHGPILFSLIRETIAKKNSPSFASFLREIS